jgi:hypothetical protein
VDPFSRPARRQQVAVTLDPAQTDGREARATGAPSAVSGREMSEALAEVKEKE